jgi:large subunit ribosomal protein L18
MTKAIKKNIRQKFQKIKTSSIKGSLERPRVVLCESNRYLRVQAINDTVGNTLAFASTEEIKKESNNNYSCKNKDYARSLGKVFADKLKKGGIKKIVFDRNNHPYHGKGKVFCEAMREQEINF